MINDLEEVQWAYLLDPSFQLVNTAGKPITDGWLEVYIHGTRTKYYCASDFDGTLHPFKIQLDSLGSNIVLASPAHAYDVYVYNKYGNLVMSRYNIVPSTGDGSVIKDVVNVKSSDNTVNVQSSDQTNWDLSIKDTVDKVSKNEQDISSIQQDMSGLDNKITEINTSIQNIDGQIQNINTSLENKKDKQNELNFNGSSTKTVTNISQDANGELNVEFADIDLPGYNITSSDGSINVSSSEGVTDLTLPNDVVRDSAYTHIDAATANPLMDGTAAVGMSTKYAREDHVHPSDTSKEAVSNKTSVVLGTSNSKYPTDKAVADFVNSSIATNTANYISNNGEPFTSVEELEAYTGTVTNNDYAFVTGTDDAGNTYYDRYKATVSGSTVTWALEYRLNNSSFTAAQWAAINSGVTSDKANYWDGKQDALTAGDNITINGNTISSDQVFVVTYGTTKYAEIKKAYNAGKICTVLYNGRYYYLSWVDSRYILFAASNGKDKLELVSVGSGNTWGSKSNTLQTHLTFDSAPTAGSNNPVTSDGIKTAINAKADGDNSVAIYDGYMRRMNESTGWRRLAYKQFNYTNTNLNALFRLYLFGSNDEHIGLGDLVVNVRFNSSGSAPELKYCNLFTHKPLNTLIKVRVIGVAGNAVVELWFRPMTYSMLTLTCLGNGLDVTTRTKDWTFERYLDATDPEPIEDVANNIYVFNFTNSSVQTSITNPTNGNLVAMDEKGLVKDSGIRITSSDIANWNRKMDKQTVGNVSEPVYIDNGIAKVATNVATTGNLEGKLNVDGSNATTAGVTAMMQKVETGTAYLTDDSYYFGDGRNDHTKIVRRPILGIWNYFAGKVQRQLLGTVGSEDKPIYLDNGIPKVCADGVPYSEVSYGGKVGYGVFVGGAHNLASSSRIYCTFFITATLYNDNIAHTYIGTFSFRGGILNCELKCLTGTPAYPLRITPVYTESGKDSNGKPIYTVGLYVIPPDKTTKYSGYKLTRIASNSDFNWDVRTLSEVDYDECNSVAKPALKPIILTWDANGSNVKTTGGTWIPTFDKATIIDCRGIVDMSIQVDLSIIGQRTYVDTLTSYEITLVNSSGTDILPVSLHQTGRMPRQAYSSSSTIDGTIDTSCTHRFIFPITSTTNLLAGYRPKITLPSNYPLDSGAQVSIKALCRGIVLPYGADEYF